MLNNYLTQLMRFRLGTARRLLVWVVGLFAVAACSNISRADIVPLLNPGGEVYLDLALAPPNYEIPASPIPPGDGTGWNGTIPQVGGDSGVEAINNNAVSGGIRMAFGATAASTVDPLDAILFQQTDQVVAAEERYVLNYFGRGFFEFGVDDTQSSFLGYLDGGGNLVQVDTVSHPEVVGFEDGSVWTQVSHTYTVPNGSPLIGEDLVIGFFTSPVDGGGFSAVDDVSLSVFPPGFLEGDVNNDGDVDFLDVQVIANFFLESTTLTSEGDLNGNGFVDFADYRIWKDAAGFNGSLSDALAAAVAVPEPSSVWLVAIAAALGATGRRRLSI